MDFRIHTTPLASRADSACWGDLGQRGPSARTVSICSPGSAAVDVVGVAATAGLPNSGSSSSDEPFSSADLLRGLAWLESSGTPPFTVAGTAEPALKPL